MQQHDAVVRQQVVAGSEKRVVIFLADMFEHSDRYDAIECPGDRRIVLNAKLAAGRFGRSARAGDRPLCLRQIYAYDGGVVVSAEVEAQAAPAGADIEYLQSRFAQAQLPGDQ